VENHALQKRWKAREKGRKIKKGVVESKAGGVGGRVRADKRRRKRQGGELRRRSHEGVTGPYKRPCGLRAGVIKQNTQCSAVVAKRKGRVCEVGGLKKEGRETTGMVRGDGRVEGRGGCWLVYLGEGRERTDDKRRTQGRLGIGRDNER